jgi:hypothetical protein
LTRLFLWEGEEVKNKIVVVLAVSTLIGLAGAQQVNTSANASASSNPSVSAGKSGANVQSGASATTSVQTSDKMPKNQEGSGSKHDSQDKNQHANSSVSSALTSGSTVNAVLANPIDSKKCKPGDTVTATATQNVKSNGSVIIPKGSKLVGHVTQAQARSGGAATSSLGIVFDHAVLKNGQQVSLNGVVQALAASQANASTGMGDDNLSAMGSTAATGTGAVRSGGGLLGGVGSTVNTATNTVANSGAVTGVANSATGSVAGSGHALQGALNSSSTGIVGLNGLSLDSAAGNSAQGSIISSTGKSVHLDSGTQMVLRVANP